MRMMITLNSNLNFYHQMLLTKQNTSPMQDIYVNQVQISRPGISVRYLKFLVGGAANIGDIPESAVVIPVSRPSDTSHCLSKGLGSKGGSALMGFTSIAHLWGIFVECFVPRHILGKEHPQI